MRRHVRSTSGDATTSTRNRRGAGHGHDGTADGHSSSCRRGRHVRGGRARSAASSDGGELLRHSLGDPVLRPPSSRRRAFGDRCGRGRAPADDPFEPGQDPGRRAVIPRVRLTVFLLAGLVLGGLFVWGFGGLPSFGHYRGVYGSVLNRVSVPERHVTDVVTAVNFDYRGF